LDLREDFNFKGMRYIFILTVLILFTSCRKRLDSFLFNNDNSITEYLLDDYTGETSLELPDGYSLPPDEINLFQYDIESEGEELTIHAIYTGDLSTIDEDTVILYCHGNAGNMDLYWTRQKLYSNLGSQGRFGVLMFDYPGYGLSSGDPTEQNMYDATEGALAWLKSQGVDNEQLIMFGFSLGSAPVCEVAASDDFSLQPNKIILEAPFASAEVMIQDASLLSMPGSFFVDLKIDNADEIKECKVPMLWMHGEADDFLAIDTHGEIVYQNHTQSWKEALRVPGAGHSTVPVFQGIESYNNTILEFILQSN
jgi:pimeloyl-ACP methyl ester carboxylesterase